MLAVTISELFLKGINWVKVSLLVNTISSGEQGLVACPNHLVEDFASVLGVSREDHDRHVGNEGEHEETSLTRRDVHLEDVSEEEKNTSYWLG
jgi:hypothetical protein